MSPLMSICTPRAWPSFGRNSAQEKPEPTISSVSHSSIMFDEASVPSRPMVPVLQGRSSASTNLPSSALAQPAPSFSATAMTSSTASTQPAPISMATFLPSLRIEAASRRSRS